jgi:hypothetical protein
LRCFFVRRCFNPDALATYYLKEVLMSFERLLHPAERRLFGPVYRPEVVLGSGEKAVDVVERRHPSTPRIYRNLREANFFPQVNLLTQA